MTLDKINFMNLSYLNAGGNMFTDPLLTQTTPLFDFNTLGFSPYMSMDTFVPTYPTLQNFNFNFEMPKFDMSMLMDMYNATIKNYQNQMSQFQDLLKNTSFVYNTKPTESLQDVNFNQDKAKEMAQNARVHAKSKSSGNCALYVSNAIEESGIPVTRGHAFQMENNLRNNENFKEISISKDEFAKLPAGCILVYPKGVAGYSSDFGHIEITLGNGETASDFLNKNPKYSENMKVFVPVTA